MRTLTTHSLNWATNCSRTENWVINTLHEMNEQFWLWFADRNEIKNVGKLPCDFKETLNNSLTRNWWFWLEFSRFLQWSTPKILFETSIADWNISLMSRAMALSGEMALQSCHSTFSPLVTGVCVEYSVDGFFFFLSLVTKCKQKNRPMSFYYDLFFYLFLFICFKMTTKT